MLAAAYGARQARNAGLITSPEFGQRLSMVVLGAWFVVTGNSLPKMLTPLSALRQDPACAQALQRFFGWTWVSMGLVFAAVWIALPTDLAEPVSVAAIAIAVLAVLTRIVQRHRARHSLG
jgi:hypothetical protein